MSIKKLQKTALILFLAVLVLLSATAIKELSSDKEKSSTAPTSTSAETETGEAVTDNRHLGNISNANPSEETPVDKDNYFRDALFIGDSRTVGLATYGDIDGADFFASVGMNVYKLQNERVSINSVSYSLDELLNSKTYGKVYVMLGINELGYNRNTTAEKYSALIESIKTAQPYAKIFIEANIHVSSAKSASSEYINNSNMDLFNAEIKKFHDGVRVFYVDPNEVFDDSYGALSSNYSSDGIHLLPSCMSIWKDYLLSKAV